MKTKFKLKIGLKMKGNYNIYLIMKKEALKQTYSYKQIQIQTNGE